MATESNPNQSNPNIRQELVQASNSSSELGLDTKRTKVLEVNQIWGNSLLDTKHFSAHDSEVSIGSSIGHKWYFLGIEMGWVKPSLAQILPFTPPIWSEVASDWKSDFYTPNELLPESESRELVTCDEKTYTAHIHNTWAGYVETGGKRYSLADLDSTDIAEKNGSGYDIAISDDTKLMVDIGNVSFYTHLVYPGQRMADRRNEEPDYPFLAIFSFVAFLGVMFGIWMYFSPKPADNEMVEIPDHFVELLLDRPEPQPKDKKKPDANPDAGEGEKAKKEEGKVGKKDAKLDKAKGNKVEVQKKELDRQVAENAGVLGALRDAGELDGIFGTTGLDASLTGGIGGLIGAKGTQFGAGGLGSRGSGLGGGGSAEGLGGLGTKGIGSGKSGYGSGGGNFGAKGEGGIGTMGGNPIILGALDRSLIDEVIKRHFNQIRYCYQRELTKNPALGGKISVKFVIAKDGTVSSAKIHESSMKNPGVEACVASRFMRMEFPQPKGGGIVIVRYPFNFFPS